jgi:preprotein translocase subunit SecG
MSIVFTILIMITAVLLILVVLIQNSKGGGLASNVGISNQIMGVQKTTDFVEKATWYLIGLLVVLVISSGFFFKSTSTRTDGNATDEIITNLEVPQAPAPAAPAAPQAPSAPQPNAPQQ